MAGGTWLSQNKVRPGAYINFKAVSKNTMSAGDRGIVAMGLPLSWGSQTDFIEVLSADLLDGTSQKKIGFTAFSTLDSNNKLLIQALSYCYKALVYNTRTGGAKATKSLSASIPPTTSGGSSTSTTLTVTAKYNGTLGNKITIAIVEEEGGVYSVITYLDGATVDKQQISTIGELEDNDYVTFSGTANAVPAKTAGTVLTGGTDGTVTESTAYTEMIRLLKMKKWQTFACFSSTAQIKRNVCDLIEQLRDDEGKYVQAVVADYDGADYEGIINSVCGATIDGLDYTKEEFVAIVAGMTAGANLNKSNTGRVITGATKIIGEMNDSEIKTALGKGKFLLSTSTSGNIKVEKDINSLHTFTPDRTYPYSKNRVIRTLDEIGTTTCQTWEDTYMGKVDNNSTGRAAFKADLINYGNDLVRLNALQNFNGAADIKVAKGNDVDAVTVDWKVQPVDSMEILYMECTVEG